MRLINFLRIVKARLKSIFIHEKYWKRHIERKFNMESLPTLPFDLFGKEHTISTYSFLDGTSMLTDLALLKALCAQVEHCHYFEIGTWRGESVQNVSDVCEKCVTLNLPKAALLELGVPESYADLHGFFSNGNPKIQHIYGNTKNFDFAQLPKFDVVFIDGDHHYNMVKNDTEKVFKYLLKESSIVVWHDYAFSPEDVRFEVFSAILDALPADKHANLYHVQNTMCAVYLPEKLPSYPLTKFDNPKRKFNVRMNVEII